jgi:threonine synthase
MVFALNCWNCDWEAPESRPFTACPACGGVLEFSSQNVLDCGVSHRAGRVSDFDALMPIVERTANHPEFDLPHTPLVHASVLSEQLGIALYIKDETGLPTGSWKDREAFVFFDRLRRHGIADVVLFSAGNTGTALARAAGILRWSRLHLVVPNNSCERIRDLSSFYQDYVTLIFHDGSNDECIEHAREYAHRNGFAREGGFTNYVRREGLKTLGLEVIHQARDLGVSFDWYVQPVAGGIGVYSFWKAHVDSGVAARQPRILGVQADICQPFVNAWRDRAQSLEPRHVPTGGTPSPFVRVQRTRNPVDSYRCLYDIQSRTGGDFVGVSDAEILAGLRLFYEEPYFRDAYSHRGMIVGLEPAAALAGLAKQVRNGAIPQGASVVLNCSGAAKPGDVDLAWLEGMLDESPIRMA